MAYKPALDEGALHSLNFRSIRTWIDKNKGRIKAQPGKTVLYSGRDYDLETKELDKGDRDTFMGTPMYLRVKQFQKRIQDRKIPCDLQTLPDVLQAIKDHPAIVDKDRHELRFANAWTFFSTNWKRETIWTRCFPTEKRLRANAGRRCQTCLPAMPLAICGSSMVLLTITANCNSTRTSS